jgi:hypothetical protein
LNNDLLLNGWRIEATPQRSGGIALRGRAATSADYCKMLTAPNPKLFLP